MSLVTRNLLLLFCSVHSQCWFFKGASWIWLKSCPLLARRKGFKTMTPSANHISRSIHHPALKWRVKTPDGHISEDGLEFMDLLTQASVLGHRRPRQDSSEMPTVHSEGLTAGISMVVTACSQCKASSSIKKCHTEPTAGLKRDRKLSGGGWLILQALFSPAGIRFGLPETRICMSRGCYRKVPGS